MMYLVQETVGSDVQINAMQLDAENPNPTCDSWTGDADLEVHPNSLPETPAQNPEQILSSLKLAMKH
jgi:hypothetical protein